MSSCPAALLSASAKCDSQPLLVAARPNLRCGTEAWVPAVPSGTRWPHTGILGQTACNSLHRGVLIRAHGKTCGACIPPKSMTTTSLTQPSDASPTQHQPPCSILELAHVFLQPTPPHRSSACPRPSPGHSFFGDCVCHCPLHVQLAAAVAAWTSLATMWRHAFALGYYVAAAGFSSGQPAARVCCEGEPQSSSTSELGVEPRRPNERRIEVIDNGPFVE